MRATSRNDMSGSARTLAIVGMGPRGLALLESLVRRLISSGNRDSAVIYAVDAVEVGAGRIWRTDQPEWFLMNTITGEITIYSGPADDGPWRPGAGPSFYEWLQVQPDARMRDYEPNACAPRVFYGLYLRDAFKRILAALPSGVRVETVQARLRDLEWHDSRCDLILDDGRRIDGLDKVVLATGHPRDRPGPEEQPFLEFTRQWPDLRYIRGDSAADMPLDSIEPGSPVGVIGAGLGFFDIVLALTAGRGGRFVGVGNGLRYVPSGREPILFAGSRSGIPIPCRGINQKTGKTHVAKYLTAQNINALRSRLREAGGNGQLDFDRDIKGLIEAEIALIFYRTEVRNRDGEEREAHFVNAFCAAPSEEVRQSLLVEWGLAGRMPPDIARLARPFGERSFESAQSYRRALLDMMDEDVRQADLGNRGSSLKAALDGIRDIRDTLRAAIDFGGLTAASHREAFLGRFAPAASLLSAGPPVLRGRQAVALIQAGLLELVGPNTRFLCDASAGRFRLESPQVAGSARLVATLVDSRIPLTNLRRDADPLIGNLVRKGMVAEFINESGPDKFATGGMAVTRSPFHVLNADGEVNKHLYALGLPTEFTRWFTQVGSGTPGVHSRFLLDADAIAADILADWAGMLDGDLPQYAAE